MNININHLDNKIAAAADAAYGSLLPKKSKILYEKAYDTFKEWRLTSNVQIINETTMLAYFYEKAKIWKSPTLWAHYSMLKSTLQLNDNIDISKFKKLTPYFKRQNENYIPKKSKVLNYENIVKFLSEAPDDTYLLIKVALVFALNGCCRYCELCNLLCNDIEDTGKVVLITLRNTKNKKQRIFTVTSDLNGYDFYKKYCALRPTNIENARFFLFYSNGKCTRQSVGIQSFSQMPKKIAQLLQLPNADLYNGHCKRRSSATLLADSGADISLLTRHGGWSSSNVAEGYIEDSVENKIKTSKRIFKQDHEDVKILRQTDTNIITPGLVTFQNLNNCVINISHLNSK